MKKLVKVLIVLIVLLAALGVFIKFEGIQYTLAYLTHGFSKPYFDIEQYSAAQDCGGATPCGSGPLKVMTYNVLCRLCAKEGFENWDKRLPHLFDKIAGYDPDLLGCQELGGNQDIDEFLARFPQYDCIAYRFGKWTYGDAALFYRADRFEALDSGQMWLGPKPDLPFSFGWKAAAMPRYVNWVFLRQKSNGFRFLYLNTHFDNNGTNKEAAALQFSKTFAPAAARMPIIVTGDFNTDSTTKRYKNIEGGTFIDAMDLAGKKEVTNNIPPEKVAKNKIGEFIDPAESIDHIFLAGPNKPRVTRWVQDATVYTPQNQWPSDHPAVYAEVELAIR